MKKNDKKEESLLNLLPLHNDKGGYNWLIPVSIIILILLLFVIVTKDFNIFNFSNATIEEILNTQKPF